ncbi:aminoacetone oxidase family FAD-binding enzyme [bacterium]|nr:aminoacetone oxidase family FAD-binding enzyme [bacterium]
MAQDFKKVAIVGGGPAGCICAYYLLKENIKVDIFEKTEPLKTLLPTGGGRCNLANAEYDFKTLASNYPRGEKFLYSIFSKFSTIDTINLFEELGIKTYCQDDMRIFPTSNSSKDVRNKILSNLNKMGANFIIRKIHNTCELLKKYNAVVIAIGGHSSLDFLRKYDISLIDKKPSLVGMNTVENFSEISGTICKNVMTNGYKGDILFTHFGISGPLIYKISSIKAFDKFPYELLIDFCPYELDLQEIFNKNPHKNLKNILKDFLPQKIVFHIFKDIDLDIKASRINRLIRETIEERIHNYKITVTSTNKGEETVMAGGVDLNEIYQQTMALKKIPNLYCIGEALNIDGFCGGFNLQNAWSTAYICAEGISKTIFDKK